MVSHVADSERAWLEFAVSSGNSDPPRADFPQKHFCVDIFGELKSRNSRRSLASLNNVVDVDPIGLDSTSHASTVCNIAA